MALTVTQCVAEVVSRISGKLAAVGLSTVATDANPDVKRAVRRGLLWVGVSPADPAAVTDDDVASVATDDVEKFFDGSTLEALIACLGQCAGVDQQVGLHEAKLSQLSAQIKAMIDFYTAKLAKPYGPQTATGGAVGTMSTGQPIPNDPFDPVCSRSRPGYWPYP